MARVEWKSFDVVSVGKIMAVIYAIVMFLVTLIYAPILAVMGLGGLGVVAIILGTILGAIGGFIGGIVCAFIYNIVAGKVGGIVVNT